MTRDVLYISSGVGSEDFAPFVEYELTANVGRMTPDEARMIGNMFLEAAVEAEKDSAICQGFLGAGQEPTEVANFLVFMRDAREAARPDSEVG